LIPIKPLTQPVGEASRPTLKWTAALVPNTKTASPLVGAAINMAEAATEGGGEADELNVDHAAQ
jgi:hypothetical protein